MTPSVGGWRKVRVALLLGGAAAATGALAGFAAGVAWAAAGGSPPGPVWLAVVLGATAVAETAYLARGRPAPPSVGRQVPQVWARLFAPETVAVLYGARLGVGPLTLLGTWSWWAALVVGAAGGPEGSALVGATFGGARVAVMVAAAEWARRDMAARMASIRRREVVVAVVTLAAAVGIAPFVG